MNNIIGTFLFVYLFSSVLSAQWTPEITLDEDINSSTIIEGKRVLYSNGTIIRSSLTLIDCDVRVENSILYEENSEIIFKGSTFRNGGSNTDWLGFRTPFLGFDIIKARIEIDNCQFYEFAELMHIRFAEGSSVSLTNNHFETDFGFSHCFHFINKGGSLFTFHGNTVIAHQNHCITLEAEDTEPWIIGDSDQSPNVFISNQNTGTDNNMAVLIRVDNSEANITFKNSIFQGVHSGLRLERGNVQFDNCIFKNSTFGFTKRNSPSDQVSFSNCAFVNNSIGARLQRSRFLFDHCEFSNNSTGLKMSLPEPSDGDLRIYNSTFANSIDVHTTGEFLDRIEFFGNTFYGSQYGIFTDGNC